jgi:hypothetical protein
MPCYEMGWIWLIFRGKSVFLSLFYHILRLKYRQKKIGQVYTSICIHTNKIRWKTELNRKSWVWKRLSKPHCVSKFNFTRMNTLISMIWTLKMVFTSELDECELDTYAVHLISFCVQWSTKPSGICKFQGKILPDFFSIVESLRSKIIFKKKYDVFHEK